MARNESQGSPREVFRAQVLLNRRRRLPVQRSTFDCQTRSEWALPPRVLHYYSRRKIMDVDVVSGSNGS